MEARCPTCGSDDPGVCWLTTIPGRRLCPDEWHDEQHGSPNLGWWAISGAALMDMLQRCANGEDPDLVYAEQYANSDHNEEPTDR